ncbi:unnamed protein product [Bursaphelenchus okinawaensis]|uniref:Cystatin domain-containing protein n=1 Tax=Bursaphelenchus okinawaensis TaxID=465554 RepID=A0A811KMW3_9BILA|nr:unnamed protein product [Bursaphelenchus okinawaensis]CAG9105870.1 unnamed protein product [Bursaphelenchus okinawaensis]
MVSQVSLLCLAVVVAAAVAQPIGGAGMPGGQVEQDAQDPEYTELAKKSMSQYAAKTNANYEFVRVKSVKTQVVAGSLTTIEFIVKDNGQEQCLKSEVLSQPWLNVEEHNVTQC